MTHGDDIWQTLSNAVDRWSAIGRQASFWLRDDDAVEPTEALDRLLALTERFAVPLALAVIPRPTDDRLAEHLRPRPHVTVIVHGWSHSNHAPPAEKKQEFGPHRPHATMLDQLRRGRERLASLHRDRFLAVFVPPWNRIDPRLVPLLSEAGLIALSTFGPEKLSTVTTVNSNVDILDWRGTRGTRGEDVLVSEIVTQLDRMFEAGNGAVGVLTHHLVHDEAAWAFLERLFATTAHHPGCRWRSIGALVRRRA